MFKNVNIVDIAIYHPEKKVDNDFFIEHFKQKGIEAEGLFNALCRKSRYVAAKGETMISMAAVSSKRLFEKCNIKPEQIDMVVFASDTPEYLIPTTALHIQNAVGAINAHVIYDINANCTGGITALDQIARHMKTNNRVKYALLVCGALMSPQANPNDPVFFGTYGDGACSVLLQNVEEEEERGFIDSSYHADSSYLYTMAVPKCGLSKLHDDIDPLLKKTEFISFDSTFICNVWANNIREICGLHGIDPRKIDHFLISQFCKSYIEETLKILEVEDIGPNKFTFIADEYGYLGSGSPLFALNRAIEKNIVKKGSIIAMCSVGGGYITSCVLFRM